MTKLLDEAVRKLFNASADNYIFVYTPPKVGSTTLVTSLRVSLDKRYTTAHIHDEVMLSVLTGVTGVTINDIIQHLSTQGKKVFVIDVYRTPVERKMSEFFEKISPYHFNNSADNIAGYSLSRIVDRFNKVFPHIEYTDHYLDKYDIPNPVPFDVERKHSVQTVRRVQYIKLRLRDVSAWGDILSKIFCADVVVIPEYQTEDKPIGALYKRFKAEYKLPSNYVDLIREDKNLRFYYSELERSQYIEEWSANTTSAVVPYTPDEFAFYMNICLENQYINDVDTHHYIDNGCFCAGCVKQRKDIFCRAKAGETKFAKMVHSYAIKNSLAPSQKKFKPRQFAIHISNRWRGRKR